MVTVLLTHHILYTIQCTPDNAHYTMNNEYSILYTVYSTLYNRLSESAGTREQCLRSKGFCEANKVSFAVLWQNPTCHELRIVHAYIFNTNLDFISMFGKLRITLLKALPPCERPSFPVRGPASL